jgi:putative PIN family toxin of toxin-antitoxin system
MRVVFDTNVLVAAVKSKTGASRRLISLLPSERFELAVSLPLYLEYLDVLTRDANIPKCVSRNEMVPFVRELLSYSHKQVIYYRWRPTLNDPNDDFVLELAIASQSSYIVTFNERDFRNIELFGIEVLSPSNFLKLIK